MDDEAKSIALKASYYLWLTVMILLPLSWFVSCAEKQQAAHRNCTPNNTASEK